MAILKSEGRSPRVIVRRNGLWTAGPMWCNIPKLNETGLPGTRGWVMEEDARANHRGAPRHVPSPSGHPARPVARARASPGSASRGAQLLQDVHGSAPREATTLKRPTTSARNATAHRFRPGEFYGSVCHLVETITECRRNSQIPLCLQGTRRFAAFDCMRTNRVDHGCF
jgi:hypothetical protein